MVKKKTKASGEDRIRSILEEIQPEFVESGAKRISHEDVLALFEHADDALAEFSDGVLERYKGDAKRMIDLVRDHCKGEYEEAPYWTVSVIVFTMLYVLKPIDIIPDSLPVIGQLDDAVVFGHALKMIRRDLDVYEEWRKHR